ncbi:equilibrative nucleoside transporter 1-like [Clytia hemisphaerica]
MIILVLISGFGAMLQGALFGLAGMMPPRYIQAVMAGQGLGGFFVCIVSILSSVGGSKITDSSFGYFCTGIFAMIISLLAYVYLERLPIVKYYTNITKGVCFCTCECENECHLNSTITNKEDTKEDDKQEKEGETTNNNNKDINYLRIIKKIKCMMLTVYITFLVTLSVFPSLTARIESTWTDQNKWTESLFVLVGCFLTYNLFDYIGKSAVSFFQKPTNERPWLLVVLAALRVLFIPLFLFCNVQPRLSNIPVAFSHDSLPIIFMALFAFTGGYLGSLPFIYGPSMVEPHEQEITATLIVFSLVAGLTSGAAFSFAIAPNV